MIIMSEENTENKDALSRKLDELYEAYAELEDLFMGFVRSMVHALDTKSKWTRGHSERVAAYAQEIAIEIGLEKEEIKRLTLAALLHDIGKIGTYDTLLDKIGKLSTEEFDIVKKHSVQGVEILKEVKQFKHILPIIRHHHERIDGKGYPDGITGEKIPLGSRILHVADSFDAMTEDRPYRPARSIEYAQEELKRCAGTQFDPQVVEVFLRIIKNQLVK
jgi:putative nucleotidyltransferase with HDIG domain